MARFWRGTRVITTPTAAGETRLIAAAMLAMPLIQKLEQGLATRVGKAVSAFFAPTDASAPGQNVPSAASASTAKSAQSPPAPALASSVTSSLLNLQNDLVHGHHHRGAGAYKAAASTASALTAQSGRATTTAITA